MRIMKRYMIPAIATILVCIAFGGCQKERYPVYVPGSHVVQEDTVVDPPTPAKDPDYSLLTAANHPRIVYSQTDFDAMKAKYDNNSNPVFTDLVNKIKTSATGFTKAADLTYTLSGKRLLAVSRSAMQRITYCAFAYKMTGESAYLTQAEKDIKTVCNFSDWNAKKHWLDVGEMATGVALGYDWLYNDLADETKTLVRKKLNDYCFTTAENKQWNLNFYEAENNWNQVCNCGIIMAALAIYENDATHCKTLIEKSLESNKNAVQAMYYPDGNYPEGYSYWNYGTEFQAIINIGMETATDSDAGLSSIQGFSKTGKYMVFMECPTSMVFNYSDCAPSSAICPALWYFAWKYKDTSVLYFEQNRYSSYVTGDDARVLPVLMYCISNVNTSGISAPTEQIFRGEGKTPIVAIHTNWEMDATDKFLGIKAGKGSTSHAHLDAGSFVYDAFGVRWSADLGLQSYGTLEPYIDLWSMTDGSERWTAFRYNNLNHSTLSVNGGYHKVAGEGVIKGLLNGDGKLGATVDITAPLGSAVSSAVRDIYMEGDNLFVKDVVKAASGASCTIRWTMVSRANPTIEYGGITLKSGTGKKMYLTTSSTTGTKVTLKTWSTVSKNSWDASNAGYYECGYEMTVPAGETCSVTVKLSPEME